MKSGILLFCPRAVATSKRLGLPAKFGQLINFAPDRTYSAGTDSKEPEEQGSSSSASRGAGDSSEHAHAPSANPHARSKQQAKSVSLAELLKRRLGLHVEGTSHLFKPGPGSQLAKSQHLSICLSLSDLQGSLWSCPAALSRSHSGEVLHLRHLCCTEGKACCHSACWSVQRFSSSWGSWQRQRWSRPSRLLRYNLICCYLPCKGSSAAAMWETGSSSSLPGQVPSVTAEGTQHHRHCHGGLCHNRLRRHLLLCMVLQRQVRTATMKTRDSGFGWL